jgi:UDP-N-acetylglucosamine transferase subunit ALG13
LELPAFEEAIQQAAVVIVHAGAGSVLSSLRLRKRPIVMARRPENHEILDNHQVEFLEQMASRRLVIPVYQVDELWARVESVVKAPEQGIQPAPVINIRLQQAIASLMRSITQ